MICSVCHLYKTRKRCEHCRKEQNKKYYKLRSETILKVNQAYRTRHKKELLIKENEYRKNKRKIDPAYRLRRNFSTRIASVLNKNNSSKNSKSILDYLPYTIQQLKYHLEKQFNHNMSWDNYGTYWHIDHIYPQSKLPYTSMEDFAFQLCWSLDNLRPLEIYENLKKSNKILSVL